MERRQSTPAVVLRTYRVGEIHRGVVMLTPGEGLVRAIAHGALTEKGRLRGSTVPFCYGRCDLYTDPVRQSTKITDMQPHDFFVGVREDIKRFYTASLWTEVILKTFASGGSSEELFALFVTALRCIDSSNAEETDRVSIQFLWRFLALSGSQPGLDHCACSGEFLEPDRPIYYAPGEQGFCSEHHASEGMVRWSAGVAAYLRHAATMGLPEAARIAPPAESVPRIKRVLYGILQDLVETPLNALRIGSGII
jgi:DNA repair protein RecO (recombination protein O)